MVRAGCDLRSFDSRAHKRYAKTTHSLMTKKKDTHEKWRAGLDWESKGLGPDSALLQLIVALLQS